MAKLIFCVAAESIITDSATNMASIMNMCEKINAPSFPAVKPLLYFMAYWKKDLSREVPEPFTFRIRIRTPDGHYIDNPQGEVHVEIPAGKERLRATSRMEGMPIPASGEMIFVVELKVGESWRRVGSYPISVDQTAV